MTPGQPAATARQREEAVPIALLGGPVSAAAHDFVEHVLMDFVLPAQVKPPRPSSVPKLRQALGALLADLFDLQRGKSGDGRIWSGAHGMSPKDFPSKHLGFGRDIFLSLADTLLSAKLMIKTDGWPNWQVSFGRPVNIRGAVTRFRLTPAMVERAASFGVHVDAWKEHWRSTDGRPVATRADEPRIVLKGTKDWIAGKKQPAADLEVDWSDPRPQMLRAGVGQLNGFLSAQKIEGVAFPGLRRIFNNGDQPDFAWNKGGRYYSLGGGHRYETWRAEKRLDEITINREPVGEVDLSGSHLTLLHALLGQPFDATSDPYAIEGFSRTLIKIWVTQAIGSSNPRPRCWSAKSKDDYDAERPGQDLSEDFPIREVGAAIKAKHPLLIDLAVCGLGPLDLQFHESEILRLAMEDLMLRQGVPVLPIHDALIAPRSRQEDAKDALVKAFGTYLEEMIGHPSPVIPKVTYKGLKEHVLA